MQQTRPYHWYCLFGAIILEVCGSTCMKLAHAWTFAHASLLGLCLMWLAVGVSYYLLALSTTGIPVGVAYAFWEGLGLGLVTLASVFVLHERLNPARALGLVCVIGGAFLINRGTSHGSPPKKYGKK